MLKQIHIYIGCFFSPLLIYFSISGAWQMFDLHHHPKDQAPTTVQSVLHDLSDPHTNATFPGKNKKEAQSIFFKIFAAMMSCGLILASLLGLQMALGYKKMRKAVVWCIVLGLLLPLVFLFVHG